jgi:hypothetical protein
VIHLTPVTYTHVIHPYTHLHVQVLLYYQYTLISPPQTQSVLRSFKHFEFGSHRCIMSR